MRISVLALSGSYGAAYIISFSPLSVNGVYLELGKDFKKVAKIGTFCAIFLLELFTFYLYRGKIL